MQDESADKLATLREKIERAVPDFGVWPNPESLAWGRDSYRVAISGAAAPHPGLVRMVLRVGLGFPEFGRGEKTAWEIPFTFNGVRSTLAHQKFGLRYYADIGDTSEAGAQKVASQVMRKISKGLRLLERDMLNPFAEEQIARGNVTVENVASTLRGMYEYFRAKVEEVEDPKAASGSAQDGDFGQSIVSVLGESFRKSSEGFFNSIAAVNAYYSWLEHVLVLFLAFSDFDYSQENVTTFMGARWSDKWKRIFDVNGDADAKRHYDRLRNLAEEYRNPYAHGLASRGQGIVYVHSPGGALPARLSEASGHVHYDFLLPGGQDPADVWSVFDGVDVWLRSGRTELPMRYIESGLDVAFDSASLARRKEAAASESSFEELLEVEMYWSDVATNMDW